MQDKILLVDGSDVIVKHYGKLLKSLFANIKLCSSAKSALSHVRSGGADLVITLAELPDANGFTLTREIRKISSLCKVIVLSLAESKKHYLMALEAKVFGYYVIPIKDDVLCEKLDIAIGAIHDEKKSIQDATLHSNALMYCGCMIITLQQNTPIFMNQKALDFFESEEVGKAGDAFYHMSENLERRNGLLYGLENDSWVERMKFNEDKYYFIGYQKRGREEPAYFKVQCRTFDENNGYTVLTLQEVFNHQYLQFIYDFSSDLVLQNYDEDTVYAVLKVLFDNQRAFQVINNYKGLSTVNEGKIVFLDEESIVIKTNTKQLGAIEHERRFYMQIEGLSKVMVCEEASVDYELELATAKNFTFADESVFVRKKTRVNVERDNAVSVSVGTETVIDQDQCSIVDLSIDGVKLKSKCFDKRISSGDQIKLSMKLHDNKQCFEINSCAKLVRKLEDDEWFYMIFMLEVEPKERIKLFRYISNTQQMLVSELMKDS